MVPISFSPWGIQHPFSVGLPVTLRSRRDWFPFHSAPEEMLAIPWDRASIGSELTSDPAYPPTLVPNPFSSPKDICHALGNQAPFSGAYHWAWYPATSVCSPSEPRRCWLYFGKSSNYYQEGGREDKKRYCRWEVLPAKTLRKWACEKSRISEKGPTTPDYPASHCLRYNPFRLRASGGVLYQTQSKPWPWAVGPSLILGLKTPHTPTSSDT